MRPTMQSTAFFKTSHLSILYLTFIAALGAALRRHRVAALEGSVGVGKIFIRKVQPDPGKTLIRRSYGLRAFWLSSLRAPAKLTVDNAMQAQ